jgi:outer membrane lipoprotein-sorting protein
MIFLFDCPSRSARRHQSLFTAVLAVAAALVCAAATRAGSPTDKPASNLWLAQQAEISTWTADFRQIRRIKALTQGLTNEGRIWRAAPGQFRWEIARPTRTIIARSGPSLIIIYPSLNQAERYSLDVASGPFKDAVDLIEAGFPKNPAEFRLKFDIVAQEETGSGLLVRLRPKSAQARRLAPEIRLNYGAKPFALLAAEMTFADGSSTKTEFSNSRYNEPVDSTLFHPSIGEETKVVEPLGSESPSRVVGPRK